VSAHQQLRRSLTVQKSEKPKQSKQSKKPNSRKSFKYRHRDAGFSMNGACYWTVARGQTGKFPPHDSQPSSSDMRLAQ
jgi:hypothetical protein